jgi:hypothetical protein
MVNDLTYCAPPLRQHRHANREARSARGQKTRIRIPRMRRNPRNSGAQIDMLETVYAKCCRPTRSGYSFKPASIKSIRQCSRN